MRYTYLIQCSDTLLFTNKENVFTCTSKKLAEQYIEENKFNFQNDIYKYCQLSKCPLNTYLSISDLVSCQIYKYIYIKATDTYKWIKLNCSDIAKIREQE